MNVSKIIVLAPMYGDEIKIGQAFFISIFAMLVVFLVLLAISYLIDITAYLLKKEASAQAPTKKVEVKQYVYSTVTDDDKIKEAFELFDSNDGRIDAGEVKDAMQNIGYDEKNPVIFQVVSELDNPRNKNSGGATFDDFCQTINYRIPEKETEEELRKIFELFLDPNSETTSLDSIKRVADEIGANIEEAELRAMLNKASKSGSELTFDDFVAIMKEKL